MASRWGHVAIAAALATLGSTAYADTLSDARRAVEGSDYLTARPLLETALKEGKAGPMDLAEIYRLTGIVEAALLELRRTVGEAEAARYSRAGRLDYSWQGLARYWRKKAA